MDTLETCCKAVVAAEAVLLRMLLLLAAGLTAVLVPTLLLKTELRRRAEIFGRPQGQQIIQQEVFRGVLSPYVQSRTDTDPLNSAVCWTNSVAWLSAALFSSASGIGALDCL